MCKITDKVRKDVNRLGELITQAVKENNALKISNDLKDVVVESSDDVVYIVDTETYEIIYLNEEAKRLFGDLLGHHCYTVFQGMPSICETCNMRELLENVGTPIKDVVHNKKLGLL